jgi:hypothetical protein
MKLVRSRFRERRPLNVAIDREVLLNAGRPLRGRGPKHRARGGPRAAASDTPKRPEHAAPAPVGLLRR